MASDASIKAEGRLATLLDHFEQGDTVVITRHGEQVGTLVVSRSPTSHQDLMRRIRAHRETIAQRLRENSQAPITTGEILDWISEGRR